MKLKEPFVSAPPFFLFLCMVMLLTPIAGCKPIVSLGKNPSGDDLKRMEAVPNYKNGEFTNLFQQAVQGPRQKVKWTGFLKYFFKRPAGTKPGKPVPFMLTNLKQLDHYKPLVVWFGHSSFLVKTKTATILADPVFNSYAGPFSGLIDAFPGANNHLLKDLPPIDVLLISHDHYDHLDYTTVRKLRKKVKYAIVPMGVGSHLKRWGFAPEKIKEVQWNEAVSVTDDLRIVSTPAHHRSNRTFAQRKTLWSSYVIEADGHKIYFSGDTGYGPHFGLIGQQYGPFDLALMECGQYNTRWPQSHMFPWQTARAAKDLGASVVIPIHWGKFAESVHPWNEPVKRLLASADSLQLPVHTPYIGQPYELGEPFRPQRWWDFD
jgi:L-ascorbate metabolism protein UlaG (beta-lactamase superfamily)